MPSVVKLDGLRKEFLTLFKTLTIGYTYDSSAPVKCTLSCRTCEMIDKEGNICGLSFLSFTFTVIEFVCMHFDRVFLRKYAAKRVKMLVINQTERNITSQITVNHFEEISNSKDGEKTRKVFTDDHEDEESFFKEEKSKVLQRLVLGYCIQKVYTIYEKMLKLRREKLN
ncbi:UNVERIFIED_CONTAM: hypothetical protein NCL1_44455 [Trichonephila clavipes]